MKAEILDLPAISTTFPRTVEHEIIRDHILDSIDENFGHLHQVVLVQGKSDIGKTTLLKQYCERYNHECISLFIRASSRSTFEIPVLRMELFTQIQLLIGKPTSTEFVDDSNATLAMYFLRKYVTRAKHRVVFVIDGLDDVPEGIIPEILDLIEFGDPAFNYLLSASGERLTSFMNQRNIRYRTVTASGFSREEYKSYLDDLSLKPETLDEIWRLCRGIPGKLASIRRLFGTGISEERMVDELVHIDDIYSLEWRVVDDTAENVKLILAVLAHDYKPNSLIRLGAIFNSSEQQMQQVVSVFEFLYIDHNTKEVVFVTDSLKNFAAGKLINYKADAHRLVLEYLQRDPNSSEALVDLPTHLDASGASEALINYLSPEMFQTFLQVVPSLSNARSHASLGLKAAAQLADDSQLMRFGMYRSILEDNSLADVWHSEIEARIALNDDEDALTLAQQTVLAEEKLHMLAIVAREKKSRRQTVDDELIQQIHLLYKTIDKNIGFSAIDIACDLMYSCPELAIDLMQRVAKTGTHENSLDYALARLSMASVHAAASVDDLNDRMDNIAEKFNNPLTDKFAVAARLLTQDYTAQQVIDEAKKLGTATDQLFLLRGWSSTDEARDDASIVLKYALRLAIETTEYSPNATLFSDLATQLKNIPDSDLPELVSSFDTQLAVLVNIGPTIDYVETQLNIAAAELKYDPESAQARVLETYYYLMAVEDLSVRSSCLALLTSFISGSDRLSSELESREGLQSVSRSDLQVNVEQLLAATAEHSQVTKPIIESLTPSLPYAALEIARSLNTETRRNAALLNIVDAVVVLPVEQHDYIYIEKVIDEITDPTDEFQSLTKIITRLDKDRGTISEEKLNSFLPIIQRIKQIPLADGCRVCCMAYNLLSEATNEVFAAERDRLMALLEAYWNCMDVAWAKVNIGYKIVANLADSSRSKALEFLDETEKFQSTVSMYGSGSVETYLRSISLSIKSYFGLVKYNLDLNEDLERLNLLISRVPSDAVQCLFYTEMALRFYSMTKITEGRRIVTENVHPLLDQLGLADDPVKNEVIVNSSPALYTTNAPTALERISSLPLGDREMAYRNICLFIIRKIPLNEPFDHTSPIFDLSYDDCLSIVQIIALMDTDSMVYKFIEYVADSAAAKGTKLTTQQRSDLASRIEKVINEKLPNPKFIQHMGYNVAAKAQISRIVGDRNWQPLINEARKIGNLADRAYVLGIISSCIHLTKQTELRRTTIREAEAIIDGLPVLKEKIEHFEHLARQVMKLENVLSRSYLRKAMELSRLDNTDDIRSSQRRIIDLADRIDPNLASTLVSTLDNDPARQAARARLDEDLEILQLRREMGRFSNSGVSDSKLKELYPKAASACLASMNAGKAGSVDISTVRDIIQLVADVPLSRSFPVFAWAIQNTTQRGNRPSVKPLLRQMYEASILASELSYRTASHSKHSNIQHPITENNAKSILIGPGRRKDALMFLENWLIETQPTVLKIVDPYYGLHDMESIRLIFGAVPECNIYILTSLQHQIDEGLKSPFQDAFRHHWRMHLSVQNPPAAQITIVGSNGGSFPIHDRWWVSDDAGLRFGTSFNSLGVGKESDISKLTSIEARDRMEIIDEYLYIRMSDDAGHRLSRESFTL